MTRILVVLFFFFSGPTFAVETSAKKFGCEDGMWKFGVSLWSIEKIPEPFRSELARAVKSEISGKNESVARWYSFRLTQGADTKKEFSRSDRSFVATLKMGGKEMKAESENGLVIFRFPEITDNIVVTIDVPEKEILSPPGDFYGKGKDMTFLVREWDNWINPKACRKNTMFVVK